MRIFTMFAAAAALLAAGGCGPGNGLTLAKVRGKVVVDGSPISYGTIMFEPLTPDAPPAAGSIGSDGSFVLSTEEPGDGAVVGAHRIALMVLGDPLDSSQPDMPDPEKNPREFMAAKSQAATPRHGRKVKAAEGSFTDPSGKTFNHAVPTKLNQTATSGLQVDVAPGSNFVEIVVDENGEARIKKS